MRGLQDRDNCGMLAREEVEGLLTEEIITEKVENIEKPINLYLFSWGNRRNPPCTREESRIS
jgi:hypothetical protein